MTLRNVDNLDIGKAKAFGITDTHNTDTDPIRLYVGDVNLYTTLSLNQNISVSGLAAGDFITGQRSGATAYVKSASGTSITVYQVSGTFTIGDNLLQSRYCLLYTSPSPRDRG